MMAKRKEKTQRAGDKADVVEKKGEREEAEGNEDECRCKEMSEKTFTGLLKVAVDDLAFWKKGKRRKVGKDA